MDRDQVFISYSHADAKWLKRLQTMLKPLTRAHRVRIWDDTRIGPGAKWREEIRDALARTKVAVLLVTPHFLASDFIATNELPPLLDAAEGQGVTILWIPVCATLYEETPIARYQAVADPARPLDSLSSAAVNKQLVSIAKRIQAEMAGVGSAVVPKAENASKARSPRYYLYISDLKVDMLFPQVPQSTRRRVTAQSGLDPDVLSGAAKVGALDHRIARLHVVIEYLKTCNEIGRLDEGRPYVSETMMMRWGPYGYRAELVYFGGHSGSTIVGWGGSTKHVLGSVGTSGAHSSSATPNLMRLLMKEVAPHSTPLPTNELEPDESQSFALLAVALATTQMRGPEQKLEFMAKKLLGGSTPRFGSVLLGTPIYVASAE